MSCVLYNPLFQPILIGLLQSFIFQIIIKMLGLKIAKFIAIICFMSVSGFLITLCLFSCFPWTAWVCFLESHLDLFV